jgi:glycosyltransferase involved in cell wall biosynthesis
LSKQETDKLISIILPAYNEEKNLSVTIESLIKVLKTTPNKYEIIIVNDGSEDKTKEIANQLSENHSEIRSVHHEKNKGYGETQITGFEESKGDYITVIPSDNQFFHSDILNYLHHIENSDIVLGYRQKRVDPKRREVYSKIYNACLSILFGLKVKDVDWVKMYKKEVIDNIEIESRSALVDTEIIIKANKKGLNIKEIPCTHLPRVHGKPTGNNIKVLARELKEFISFWSKNLKK